MSQNNIFTSINKVLKIIIVGMVLFDKFSFYTNHIVTDVNTVSKWSEAKADIGGLAFSFKVNDKEYPHPLSRFEYVTNTVKKDKFFITYVLYDVMVVLSALAMLKFNSFVFPSIIIVDSMLCAINVASSGFDIFENFKPEDTYWYVVKTFNKIYPLFAGKSFFGFFFALKTIFVDFFAFWQKMGIIIGCIMVITFNCIAYFLPEDYYISVSPYKSKRD